MNEKPVFVEKKLSLDWINILFLVITPLVAFVATPIYVYRHGIHWAEIVAFFVFYWSTGLGITMGYHRLFTHRAYEAHPVLKFLLLIFGAMALENSAYKWSSDHRFHHKYTDHDGDPYNARKGFWHSHILWVFYKEPTERSYDNVPDLAKDRLVMWQDRYYLPLSFGLGWALPLLIGFCFGRPLGFFLWGGLVRTVFVHHGTFFINSLAHICGRQTYDDTTTARDSWWLALLAFGEGFHNFHHRFQADYRNGVRWYHWDPSKWIINILSRFKITTNLKRSADQMILARRLEMDIKRMEQRLAPRSTGEKWQSIKLELEHARLSLEKTLTEWKSTLAEYAHMKMEMPKRAQELREQFKQRTKELKLSFRESMKEWNEICHQVMQEEYSPDPSQG